MSGHRESVEQAEWIQVHQNAYRSARAAEQARSAKEPSSWRRRSD